MNNAKNNVLSILPPIGSKGGMKSLWDFMRDKNLTQAIRCSLENFGQFDYTDPKAGNDIRHVTIIPLYAISQLNK